MKYILIFISIFLFVVLAQIYIVGGYDLQTIHSKLGSIITGTLIGLLVSALVYAEDNDK